MKTYLLRNVSKVQPQRQLQPLTAAGPLLGQPLSQSPPRALFMGLDVHAGSIAVSLDGE